MTKPSLAEIFAYTPGAVSLVGFPNSAVLSALSSTLGEEISLSYHQRQLAGRKGLIPSFPAEFIEQRRDFFQRLPDDLGDKMPRVEFSRATHLEDKNFTDLCERAHGTVEATRKGLKEFKHLPEARRVLARLNRFDHDLEASLNALHQLDNQTTFAIDSESGIIVPLDKMPSIGDKPCYIGNNLTYPRDIIPSAVTVNMREKAIRMIRAGKKEFRKRIEQFANAEFRFDSGSDNLRKFYEEFLLPLRLFARYQPFGDWCRNSDQEMPQLTDAEFSSHYNIRNLSPPSLIREEGWQRRYVPVDFKTKKGERKFLLVGLHSGGKSFFLENIVLASVLAQIPLPLPADNLVLPRYNHISYYNCPRNSASSGRSQSNGHGKLLSEVDAAGRMMRDAGENDLLVFDEFLDSASTGIAPWIAQYMLDELAKCKATVFVSTHRVVDYRPLERKGWTILSPEHTIIKEKVVPARRLRRGRPDEAVNIRYAQEKVREILSGRY